MDRTMQALALVALLLYLAPAALGGRLTDGQRTWLWRAAFGALAVGAGDRDRRDDPLVHGLNAQRSRLKLGCFAALHKIIAAHLKLH